MFLLCITLYRVTAVALDEDEHSGLAADTLTIRVGYFGGPYYDKAVFTVDELWEMDVVYGDYTFIDNMPSVVINHVAGVTLADIMGAAGIDLNSVQSFNFWTNDKEGGYYTSLTKSFLIDTPRYCYYSLPDNFDYDSGGGNEYATIDKEWVPTVMALADDWNRSINGASFGSDYQNLNTNTRFRLVYGQTDAQTRTASSSAKWVHSIEVTLGGAPTLEMDASILELEVGSKRRTEARVHAADEVIAQNAVIEWSSGDESIATVDENGEITVHREGSVEITASLGETVATTVISGVAAKSNERPDLMSIGDVDGNGDSAVLRDMHIGGDNRGENDAVTDITIDGNITGQTDGWIDGGADNVALPDGDTSLTENTALLGHEITILNASESEDESGGVQNWRTEEMSKTAVELPIIPTGLPLGAAALSVTFVFILGGAFKFIQYKLALEGRYAFRRNI